MATDEAPDKSSKSAGRPLGQTGETVRRNIRDIRDKKGISGPELSEKLAELHRPIPPLGIHRIESGTRRVDVDDLVAIALALNVSPLALLLPTWADAVLADGERYLAEQIWDWATGVRPLSATEDVLEFIRYSDPFGWVVIKDQVEQNRDMNPSVQGALASSAVSNRKHTARRRAAGKTSRGDD
ncbi:MAG TPA: helix-turn-helix transcriptional regulator [Mycobacterium sp.]|nr:helix-turn-helix transcriptional regulator [Mycobacterium sp.]